MAADITANQIHSLSDLPDITGIPVIVRLDLNVPIADGRVVDDYRIRKALPTLDFLRQRGAKIIALSHIEGTGDTLRPVFEYLKRSQPITFCEDILADGTEALKTLAAGSILLCENIRRYPGEKTNDPIFAEKLATLGKYYVNDAFSVSHREHASIVGLPKHLPGYIGVQFEKEVAALSLCFTPKHPFLFILGGAKFETKLPLVEKFLEIADTVFVGGALANDIYKARGLAVGTSLLSDTGATPAITALATDKRVIVPVDDVVESPSARRVCDPTDVAADESIADAGPATLVELGKLIAGAKQILWNGPLGAYERGFTDPTKELAKLAASATVAGATVIVGGGDTLAAIADLKLESSFTFVSTGGGAMLDFLANGSLPGLDALKIKSA